jgi:hypothetical protein
MTDITPTGPLKPLTAGPFPNTPEGKRAAARWAADINDGWTTANTLEMYKLARARYKDKLLSATNSPRVSGNVLVSAFRRQDNLKIDIIRVKNRISELERQKRAGTLSLPDEIREFNKAYEQLALFTAELEVVNAQTRERNRTIPGSSGGTGGGDNKKKKPPKPTDNRLRYNVGSVSEAYFTSRTEFLLESGNTDTLSSAVKDNKPSAALTSALELWANGQSSKGMFTTWRDLSTGFDDKAADEGLMGTNEKLPPHAFRFQYNPGSISMSYAGTPLVDPNFEAAGLDKFNLTGTGVTQSTIQFQLLINRMYDMKYYTREGENIPDGEGGFNEPGTLKPGAGEVYGTEFVSLETQKAIYNMGTMYDFEYLLRTMMGYTMQSALRDYSFFEHKGTADMGFLGARPVELHLGKNMRYLVFVTGINVEHVIFDNRMVPLFSNVSITCSRLPDYQSTNNLLPQTGELPANNRGFTGSEDYRKALRQ